MEYTKDTIHQVFSATSYWLRDSESFIAARPMSYHDEVLYCRVRDEDLRDLYSLLPEIITALLEYDSQKLRPNGGAPEARNNLVKESVVAREGKLPPFVDSDAVLRTPVIVDLVQVLSDKLCILGFFAELYTTSVNNQPITVVTKSHKQIANIKYADLETQYPGSVARLDVGKSLELKGEELFTYVLAKATLSGVPTNLTNINFT